MDSAHVVAGRGVGEGGGEDMKHRHFWVPVWETNARHDGDMAERIVVFYCRRGCGEVRTAYT